MQCGVRFLCVYCSRHTCCTAANNTNVNHGFSPFLSFPLLYHRIAKKTALASILSCQSLLNFPSLLLFPLKFLLLHSLLLQFFPSQQPLLLYQLHTLYSPLITSSTALTSIVNFTPICSRSSRLLGEADAKINSMMTVSFPS